MRQLLGRNLPETARNLADALSLPRLGALAQEDTVMSPKKSRSSSAKSAGAIADSSIAVRAFERWMGRGCPASDGVEDWLAARSELEAELASAPVKGAPRKMPAKANAQAEPSPASIH
jgi:hypothetical protein